MLYNPSTGSASGASGQNVVTIAGADISVVTPGMTIYFGPTARARPTSDGYYVDSVSPTGNAGGKITLKSNLAATLTGSPFAVIGWSANTSLASSVALMLSRILSTLQSRLGFGTGASTDDPTIFLDKPAPTRFSKIAFALAGVERFRIRQENVSGVETLEVASSTDGTNFTPALTVGASGLSISANSLTSGTIPNARLPTRLAPGILTMDADAAIEDGFYRTARDQDGAINLPPATGVHWLITVRSLDNGWVIQDAIDMIGSASAGGTVYRRYKNSGVWGSWFVAGQPLRLLDARYAPAPTTASQVGRFFSTSTAVGGAAVLPSGGTWTYHLSLYNLAGAFSGTVSGVSAGGTTVGASIAGYYWSGWAWRTA